MTERRGARSARRVRVALGLALLTVGAACVCAQAPAVKVPQFEKDVLPILSARCLKCHGTDKPKAGLDLRSRAGMLKGGETGPALMPGSADKSLIFEMVRKGDMPPKDDKLTAEQVALVKAWIDAGAPADEGAPPAAVGRTVTEEDRSFWAFRKPARPAVPNVRHAERLRTPIDAFILAKLEAKGLTFSQDADRAALLRRVSFDLTGLPPSPDEIAAVMADTRPHPYH